MSTLEVKMKIKTNNIVSVIFPSENVYLFVTKDGELLNKHLERIFYLSPLLCPIIDCFFLQNSISCNELMVVSNNQIAMTSITDLNDYESFVEEKSKYFIKTCTALSENDFVVLDKATQKCYIFEKNHRKPTHILTFKNNEYTVDIATDNNFLYTLTSGGVLSKWKPQPKGRFDRVKSSFFNLSYCKRIVRKTEKYVVIQTTSKLHVIALEDQAEK